MPRSDPGNALWQRDVAISYGRIALVLKQSGTMAEAHNGFSKGREMMARLTQISPDNAIWKRDLARFEAEIAEFSKR
ncbi:MAG TPA: hypothetical protein VFG05_06670 [Methylocella sp.]|nr:hypothetical protein [Methylocella sp.]